MKTYCLCWLGNRDSNPNKQSQSLSCYRYTIPQNIEQYYYISIFYNVKSFFEILSKRMAKMGKLEKFTELTALFVCVIIDKRLLLRAKYKGDENNGKYKGF